MRWLVVACTLVLATRSAAAKIVIMEPPLARACQTAKSWPLLVDCMKQHGLKATISRQIDGAKLVVVQSVEAKHGEIETWALYVANGTGWKLGGLVNDGSNLADSEVLRFERVTSGAHHGYRFDIAMSSQSAVSLDQVTTQTSTLRQTQATFCSGSGYSCMTLVPSCVQLVQGQAVLAFQGEITVADNLIKLTGIGTTPQSCSAAATYTAMLQ
jgi:hypothetical protein